MSAVAIAEVPHGTSATLEELPLDLVDVAENVRVDPGELEELAASIRELGVLQPIRAIGPGPDGRYRAVWGQRRILASRLAERLTIPALVEPAAAADVAGARRSIEQLAENLQRKDLNPVEEAVALRAVLDSDPTLTQDALAGQLGRSRPWVSNALRLLGLDEKVLDMVRAGEISASHGKAIASLPAKQQHDLARSVVAGNVSSSQLEREIQWKRDQASLDEKKAAKTERWIPKAIAALNEEPVPLDAVIYVNGPYYDMDMDKVRSAIRKAGWKNAGSEYAPGRPSAGECDCTSYSLDLAGRKAVIQGTCTDQRHRDRDRNIQRQLDDAERVQLDLEIAALRAELERQLRATSLPAPLIAAIAKVAGGYYSGAEKDPYRRIAEGAFTQYSLRDVDRPALFAELGIMVPVALAPTKRSRKAKAE